jgi:hypothetical protein
MIPDVVRDSKKVILECDKRLQGLFRRSFPAVDVYGTRRVVPVDWHEGYQIDASVPAGGLGRFYRRSPEACPRTPYLIADPLRRDAMREWLGSGKKKIGLTWSGGMLHTEQAERDMGLKALTPLFDKWDATFVSLQYKPCDVSGTPVKVHPLVEANTDYDDAAALVAELDMVVGVHTSAHHLAGALGVPTLTYVPTRHSWYYQSDTFPWYPLTLFRQRPGEKWVDTVRRSCS